MPQKGKNQPQTSFQKKTLYEPIKTPFQIDSLEAFKEVTKIHDLIEKQFVSCLVQYSEVFYSCSEYVHREDFYNKRYAAIYEEVSELIKKGTSPDVISLSKSFKLSEITWLWTEEVIRADATRFAIEVHDNAVSRRIFDISENLKHGFLRRAESKELAIYLQEELDELSRIAKDKQTNFKAKEIIKDLEKEIEAIKKREFVGFPTFQNLDQLVDGLIIPHIWIIGGYSGTGKTFFTLQIVERILKENAKVLMFSTENSKMRTMLRLIGCHTGIPEMKILKGELSPQEQLLIDITKKHISEKTLIIYDDIFDTSDIRLKMKKHCKEDGVNVTVIDYIQQLNIRDDNYEQMRLVSSDLQKLAKETQSAIIAVSQISNEGQRSKSFFRMSFKGAGEIGAIADVAIELKRSESEFNTLGAIIKKVRHGIPGKIKFQMFTEQNKINKNYIEEIL